MYLIDEVFPIGTALVHVQYSGGVHAAAAKPSRRGVVSPKVDTQPPRPLCVRHRHEVRMAAAGGRAYRTDCWTCCAAPRAPVGRQWTTAGVPGGVPSTQREGHASTTTAHRHPATGSMARGPGHAAGAPPHFRPPPPLPEAYKSRAAVGVGAAFIGKRGRPSPRTHNPPPPCVPPSPAATAVRVSSASRRRATTKRTLPPATTPPARDAVTSSAAPRGRAHGGYPEPFAR